jgi:hypothetical protein
MRIAPYQRRCAAYGSALVPTPGVALWDRTWMAAPHPFLNPAYQGPRGNRWRVRYDPHNTKGGFSFQAFLYAN